MDVSKWKNVLLAWIKTSEIFDVYTLEQVDLDEFFGEFHYRLFDAAHDNCDRVKVTDFLRENFPEYKILYSDANSISPHDYIYIFSIFLYHSCVTQENEYYQLCCQELNAKYQLGIFTFMEYFNVNPVGFSKESLRTAIRQSINTMSPEKPSGMFTITSSPLVTPKKMDYPATPKKAEGYDHQLKELKHLKTQLDNEKFEKSMLEVEIRQNQEKVEHLVLKCQTLNFEAQKLRTELLTGSSCQNENCSPNVGSYSENRKQNRMQKEIQKRDDLIADLRIEIESISATNKKYKEKTNTMEKQMRDMYNKILDLDASLNELRNCVNMKEETIRTLEKENREYSEHLSEARSMFKDSSSSSDALEFSCSTYYHTVNNSSYTESIGKSLIDMQLKEKDAEIYELRENLMQANAENSSLEQRIATLIRTIKRLEAKINSEEFESKTKFEEMSEEMSQHQVPIRLHSQEGDKVSEYDETVVTTSSVVDDDETDWIENDDDDDGRRSSGLKRLSINSLRDKTCQRELYQQRQKQMRNKTFNDRRRSSASMVPLSTENTP